jgi:uncharacterized cupin superfamily protein
MLEGEVGYRHSDKTYVLRPGDCSISMPTRRTARRSCASCRSASFR